MGREAFSVSVAIGLPSQHNVNQTEFPGIKNVSVSIVPTGIDKVGGVLDFIGSNHPLVQQSTPDLLGSVTIADINAVRNLDFSNMGYDFIFIQYTPATETVGTYEIEVVTKI